MKGVANLVVGLFLILDLTLAFGNEPERHKHEGHKPDPIFSAHLLKVDHEAKTVDFLIEFKHAPDFGKTDKLGRQAYAFQFFISPTPIEMATFYQTAAGANKRHDLIVVRMERSPHEGKVRLRREVPGFKHKRTPWGPVIREMNYSLDGRNVVFQLPLSAFDGYDGRIYYYLEGYRYGAWDGETISGSTVLKQEHPGK